ncbi:hypothetical protein R3P38DRAFT_2758757 [Favolaschia claudopus]|uniref:Uncharacterized protein n=1 Tax=Favolaschia claudopus TaxID=2862362 RepID=A0AAW0E5Y5_9AGAR
MSGTARYPVMKQDYLNDFARIKGGSFLFLRITQDTGRADDRKDDFRAQTKSAADLTRCSASRLSARGTAFGVTNISNPHVDLVRFLNQFLFFTLNTIAHFKAECKLEKCLKLSRKHFIAAVRHHDRWLLQVVALTLKRKVSTFRLSAAVRDHCFGRSSCCLMLAMVFKTMGNRPPTGREHMEFITECQYENMNTKQKAYRQ